jgi:hypothetical protein
VKRTKNNNFIHSARPQAPDPGRIGIAKTVAQFAATHLTGRIANRGLLCQAKRLPAAITCVRADAAPAKRMICQNAAGSAIRPCAKFERKLF